MVLALLPKPFTFLEPTRPLLFPYFFSVFLRAVLPGSFGAFFPCLGPHAYATTVRCLNPLSHPSSPRLFFLFSGVKQFKTRLTFSCPVSSLPPHLPLSRTFFSPVFRPPQRNFCRSFHPISLFYGHCQPLCVNFTVACLIPAQQFALLSSSPFVFQTRMVIWLPSFLFFLLFFMFTLFLILLSFKHLWLFFTHSFSRRFLFRKKTSVLFCFFFAIRKVAPFPPFCFLSLSPP